MTNRYHFSTTDRPSRLARKLQGRLKDLGIDRALKDVQQAVAEMFGYRHWQELTQVTGTMPPSPDDDYSRGAIVVERHRQQLAAIVSLGVAVPVATEIVDELHPTNTVPSNSIVWRPHEDGEVTIHAGRAHWVGPNRHKGKSGGFGTTIMRSGQECPYGPDTDYCIFGGRAEDGRIVIHRNIQASAATDLGAGKAEVEAGIMKSRRHLRELASKDRSQRASIPDGAAGYDNPWGEVQYATTYPHGILELECDHHGGFRVPIQTMVEMVHPRMWSYLIADGYAFYEEDCDHALLTVGLPDIFTSVEQEGATRLMEQFFSELLSAHRREPLVTDDLRARALAELERSMRDETPAPTI